MRTISSLVLFASLTGCATIGFQDPLAVVSETGYRGEFDPERLTDLVVVSEASTLSLVFTGPDDDTTVEIHFEGELYFPIADDPEVEGDATITGPLDYVVEGVVVDGNEVVFEEVIAGWELSIKGRFIDTDLEIDARVVLLEVPAKIGELTLQPFDPAEDDTAI